MFKTWVSKSGKIDLTVLLVNKDIDDTAFWINTGMLKYTNFHVNSDQILFFYLSKTKLQDKFEN